MKNRIIGLIVAPDENTAEFTPFKSVSLDELYEARYIINQEIIKRQKKGTDKNVIKR